MAPVCMILSECHYDGPGLNSAVTVGRVGRGVFVGLSCADRQTRSEYSEASNCNEDGMNLGYSELEYDSAVDSY